MRLATLPYRIPFGTPHLLPLCDIHVLGPRGRARVTSLIDTGAFYSVFPTRVAEDVGLPLPKSPNFTIQYGGSITLGRRSIFSRFNEVVFLEKVQTPRVELRW